MTDRVLLFNDSAHLDGGAEVQVKREQRYLTDQGYAVRSVGIGDPDEEVFTDEVIPESDSFLVREIGGLTVSLGVLRKFRSIIARFDPDVVHVHKSQKYPATVALATLGYPSMKTHHDYSTVCPSAWAVKQDTYEVCECGVGAKCWRHGCRSRAVVLGHYVPRHKLQKPIERAIIDEHVAPSASLTRYLREFGYEAQQIRNPESVRPETDSSDEGYFLFIGRLDEEKGVPVLIEAIETLAANGTDLEAKIAGKGPLQQELRERTSGLDHVELPGYVSEERKASLLAGARAVVVPSIWMENYPTVVLEAMAYGKPVVGSDRGGISEMVEHDHNGLLYPPLDAESLASHLQTLHRDRSKAHDMGKNGRDWLRQSSTYETFGRQIEALFDGLTDGE